LGFKSENPRKDIAMKQSHTMRDSATVQGESLSIRSLPQDIWAEIWWVESSAFSQEEKEKMAARWLKTRGDLPVEERQLLPQSRCEASSKKHPRKNGKSSVPCWHEHQGRDAFQWAGVERNLPKVTVK